MTLHWTPEQQAALDAISAMSASHDSKKAIIIAGCSLSGKRSLAEVTVQRLQQLNFIVSTSQKELANVTAVVLSGRDAIRADVGELSRNFDGVIVVFLPLLFLGDKEKLEARGVKVLLLAKSVYSSLPPETAAAVKFLDGAAEDKPKEVISARDSDLRDSVRLVPSSFDARCLIAERAAAQECRSLSKSKLFRPCVLSCERVGLWSQLFVFHCEGVPLSKALPRLTSAVRSPSCNTVVLFPYRWREWTPTSFFFAMRMRAKYESGKAVDVDQMFTIVSGAAAPLWTLCDTEDIERLDWMPPLGLSNVRVGVGQRVRATTVNDGSWIGRVAGFEWREETLYGCTPMVTHPDGGTRAITPFKREVVTPLHYCCRFAALPLTPPFAQSAGNALVSCIGQQTSPSGAKSAMKVHLNPLDFVGRPDMFREVITALNPRFTFPPPWKLLRSAKPA